MPDRAEDRRKEVCDVVANANQYQFTVIFTRELEDDISCGGNAMRSDDPLGVALRKQFCDELQVAYDKYGMGGRFEIVSGPSLKLDTK